MDAFIFTLNGEEYYATRLRILDKNNDLFYLCEDIGPFKAGDLVKLDKLTLDLTPYNEREVA